MITPACSEKLLWERFGKDNLSISIETSLQVITQLVGSGFMRKMKKWIAKKKNGSKSEGVGSVYEHAVRRIAELKTALYKSHLLCYSSPLFSSAS